QHALCERNREPWESGGAQSLATFALSPNALGTLSPATHRFRGVDASVHVSAVSQRLNCHYRHCGVHTRKHYSVVAQQRRAAALFGSRTVISRLHAIRYSARAACCYRWRSPAKERHAICRRELRERHSKRVAFARLRD